MSASKVQVLVPPQRPIGVGAAALFDVIAAAAAAMAGSLAHRRHRRGVERRARRRARDRAELVALARQYAASQPSFASDLHAAALRDGDEG